VKVGVFMSLIFRMVFSYSVFFGTMSLVFEVLIIILYVVEFSPFYSKINFRKEYSVII